MLCCISTVNIAQQSFREVLNFCTLFMQMQIFMKRELFPILQIFSRKYETFATFFSPFQFQILLNFICRSGSFSFTLASHHFYPYFAKVYAKHSETIASGKS